MISTSTLNLPAPTIRGLGVRRIAAVVLFVIALVAVAFLLGRTTASSHSSLTSSTTSVSQPVSGNATDCRPHVPC